MAAFLNFRPHFPGPKWPCGRCARTFLRTRWGCFLTQKAFADKSCGRISGTFWCCARTFLRTRWVCFLLQEAFADKSCGRISGMFWALNYTRKKSADKLRRLISGLLRAPTFVDRVGPFSAENKRNAAWFWLAIPPSKRHLHQISEIQPKNWRYSLVSLVFRLYLKNWGFDSVREFGSAIRFGGSACDSAVRSAVRPVIRRFVRFWFGSGV